MSPNLGKEQLSEGNLLLVLVHSLGERDMLHRVALSDSGRKARFYPAGAALTDIIQCLLK